MFVLSARVSMCMSACAYSVRDLIIFYFNYWLSFQRLCLHVNENVYVTCNFNCHIDTEGTSQKHGQSGAL